MERAWRQECCARGHVLSGSEVMRRVRRRECRARGCAFSLRGTAGQRPRKPGTRGAAWSSSKACHAEMRHLSRHSPSPRPDGHFPSVAERDTTGASSGAFPGAFPGALPGLSRGLYRGLFRGLHRGFPGAWRAEMRHLFQTRHVDTPGQALFVSRRTGRNMVFIGGLARGDVASIPCKAR